MPCGALSISCILGASHGGVAEDPPNFAQPAVSATNCMTAPEGDSSNMAKKIEMKQRQTNGLLQDTEGLTTVEYIIILCLIAVVGFAAWQKFGDTVQKKVGEADGVVNSLPGTVGGS